MRPGAITSALPIGVTRFHSGSADISITEAAANQALASGYVRTRYGREFAILLRRNCGGRLGSVEAGRAFGQF